MAIPRIIAAIFAILLSYHNDQEPQEYPFDLYHKNGDKKSSGELEEESLEESFCTKFRRFISRPSFVCEMSVLLTATLLVFKAMARLNVEIGIYDESRPLHPLFWTAVFLTALCLLLEASYVDHEADVAGVCGRARRQDRSDETSVVERIGQTLTQPLLGAASQGRSTENGNALPNGRQANGESLDDTTDVEQGNTKNEDVRGKSDIGGDANYQAQWSDLFGLLGPDVSLVILSMVFLVLAALANICVPKFTGNVLDALVSNSSDEGGDPVPYDVGAGTHRSILDLPGFMSNVELLVLASLLGGIFGGIRGAIFTIVSVFSYLCVCVCVCVCVYVSTHTPVQDGSPSKPFLSA